MGGLPSVAQAQSCPGAALATPKRSVLYLYFPTATDATFPNYGAIYGYPTSPAEPFDINDLDPSVGTTAQLQQRVFELVRGDYCEFDVDVRQTNSNPSPPVSEPRWQKVAVCSDSSSLFGIAEDVDIGDANPQDHGRVWAKTFDNLYGGSGGVLNGANSTLERWANAIAGTTSHEAAHNYGVAHGNSAPRPTEDSGANHLLGTGSTGLTGADRVKNRHFSDNSYEILGYNLGLTWKTVNNWDFVNPNNTTAYSMKMTVLSTASSLTLSWSYNGPMSPWINPTVSGPSGTMVFQGTTYNIFTVTWSTPQSWANGAPGEVPAAAKFHTGAAFNETNPIVIREVRLFDASMNQMHLHPRVFGYDTATFDVASGTLNLGLFNLEAMAGLGPLEIRQVQVLRLPRVAHIDSMMVGQEPFGVVDRLPISPWSVTEFDSFELDRHPVSLPIGRLTEKRNVDVVYTADDCLDGAQHDAEQGVPEPNYCPVGTALSRFPSTVVYVIATVIDPQAEQWDPQTGEFIVGPLETRVFYQFEGKIPDLNGNGVDDLLDIRNETSQDRNQNGVPDEAEKEQPDHLVRVDDAAV